MATTSNNDPSMDDLEKDEVVERKKQTPSRTDQDNTK